MKRIFILFAGIYLFSCHSTTRGINPDIYSLPNFEILLTDSSTHLISAQIPEGKSIIMIYFRPDCPHCRAETKNILKNIESFKSSRLYFLAGAPLEDIKNFSTSFNLGKYANIVVGKDLGHTFAKTYQLQSIPYLALYDGQKHLEKVYIGEVPINTIIGSIHI